MTPSSVGPLTSRSRRQEVRALPAKQVIGTNRATAERSPQRSHRPVPYPGHKGCRVTESCTGDGLQIPRGHPTPVALHRCPVPSSQPAASEPTSSTVKYRKGPNQPHPGGVRSLNPDPSLAGQAPIWHGVKPLTRGFAEIGEFLPKNVGATHSTKSLPIRAIPTARAGDNPLNRANSGPAYLCGAIQGALGSNLLDS